jgi:presenilin-like A22 family membrane protease
LGGIALKKLFAGMGIIGLCALCCAIPAIGITGFVGIVGVSFGIWKWGVLLIALALFGLLYIKKSRACNTSAGCNCSSGSCKHN